MNTEQRLSVLESKLRRTQYMAACLGLLLTVVLTLGAYRSSASQDRLEVRSLIVKNAQGKSTLELRDTGDLVINGKLYLGSKAEGSQLIYHGGILRLKDSQWLADRVEKGTVVEVASGGEGKGSFSTLRVCDPIDGDPVLVHVATPKDARGRNGTFAIHGEMTNAKGEKQNDRIGRAHILLTNQCAWGNTPALLLFHPVLNDNNSIRGLNRDHMIIQPHGISLEKLAKIEAANVAPLNPIHQHHKGPYYGRIPSGCELDFGSRTFDSAHGGACTVSWTDHFGKAHILSVPPTGTVTVAFPIPKGGSWIWYQSDSNDPQRTGFNPSVRWVEAMCWRVSNDKVRIQTTGYRLKGEPLDPGMFGELKGRVKDLNEILGLGATTAEDVLKIAVAAGLVAPPA